jgi:hypothetical protein
MAAEHDLQLAYIAAGHDLAARLGIAVVIKQQACDTGCEVWERLPDGSLRIRRQMWPVTAGSWPMGGRRVP